jgi:hypothetical protein
MADIDVQRCGRVFIPDERDNEFQMRQAIRQSSRRRRYWPDWHWVGDQGWRPHCVGFAWVGWLEAGPIRHISDTMPVYNPSVLYRQAQKVDRWPGERYAGTSVRAGAKVLRKLGYIQNYYWARNLGDIIQALLTRGPVVVGTAWYSQMNRPTKGGIARARGKNLGGHAWLLTGVNRDKQLLRGRNSYGLGWGKNGRLYIPFKDMAKLLRMQGEACLATELATGG